jgi:SAM-dependent methyltransferase
MDTFRQLPQTGLNGWPPGYWQQRAYSTAEFWRVVEGARRAAERLPIGSMGLAVDLSDGMGWLGYCLDVSGFNTLAVSQDAGPYGLAAYEYARYLRVQASLERPPLAQGAFDLVVFSFGLDGLDDLQTALRYAAALLQPDGHLLVMTDAGDNERRPATLKLVEHTLREAGLSVRRRRVGPMGSSVDKLAQIVRRATSGIPPLVIGRR